MRTYFFMRRNINHINPLFRQMASEKGLPAERIDELSSYAADLEENKLPIIYDQIHFSKLVGYNYDYILAMSNDVKSFYKEYQIPKKHGGKRTLEEPYPDLKYIQSWILKNILEKGIKQFISPVAKAFIPGKKLRDNARFHRGNKVVIVLDITDFYTNIQFAQVYNIFIEMKYTKALSMLFARLCTYDNYLPQGAPTSPLLSNMIMKSFDQRLWTYCKRRNVNYTRYADDMTFSGDEIKIRHLITYVKQILPWKLKLNEEKTNVMGTGRCQKVTGVVVNEKLQVTRSYRDKIRQEVYYCIKFGISGHRQRLADLPQWINDDKLYIQHLLGKINYVLQINPNDHVFAGYSQWLKEEYKRRKV